MRNIEESLQELDGLSRVEVGKATEEVPAVLTRSDIELTGVGLLMLAKQLRAESSELRVEVEKSTDGAVVEVRKAGAVDALERIAAVFGFQPGDEEMCESHFAYKVEDAVRALQQAARAEKVMVGLAGIMKSAVQVSSASASDGE